MTWILVRKSLRDLRLGLIVLGVLLVAFQALWVKVTQRVTGELVPLVPPQLEKVLFKEGPGKMLQALMGGENISIARAMDFLSIGYVHPLLQALLCVWAVGRAAGAITGELDRGTMELLMAQPVPRGRVILGHLCTDAITIPILCLCIWGGTLLGMAAVGPIELPPPQASLGPLPLPRPPVTEEQLRLDPLACLPALLNVAALLFAVGGYTLYISARGRFRGRVLGAAVILTLVQFLVNVIGQLWEALEPLRPLTVFYYYQPQEIILNTGWAADLRVWGRLGVLLAVGAIGYLLALRVFRRRDLPAPL